MAYSLIALGSNLGQRAVQLGAALLETSRIRSTQLIRRSRWFETLPIGGPAGQGSFLNAAALLETSLEPVELLAELRRIERELGRVRRERWAARSLDLDLLLYDDRTLNDPLLTLPHPRMSYRRFVLEPAAEAAPWMVHATCGWTVQALKDQLDCGADVVAVAARQQPTADDCMRRLAERFKLPLHGVDRAAAASSAPSIIAWDVYRRQTAATRPKLILALTDDAAPEATGVAMPSQRKMLHLPSGGPVAWIPSDGGPTEQLAEAAAAMQAVWPCLTP